MSADALVARLLLDLAAIICASQLVRSLLGRIGQPKALAEIIAGLALGPSLLGRLPGDPSKLLFPEQVRPALSLIGALGLTFFAFAVGLQINPPSLRRRGRTLLSVSAGALIVPFLAGGALAVALYQAHHNVHGHTVAELPFVLFVATAMSITAFPVLAAILTERGLRRTSLGELALGSAAVQDGVGWILLAVALSVLSARSGISAGRIGLELCAFLVGLIAVVRPLLRALLSHRERSETETLAIGLAAAVACAGATQLIGIHEVVGAFAAGVAFPRTHARASQPLVGGIMPITLGVLLPVYFVTPGLQVNVAAITPHGIAEWAAIMLVACLSKLAGAVIPARLSGLSWDEAGPLAVLLNTRGLMEIVVLTVGYTDGVLDQALFTELVLMAIATTMITCPLLDMLKRRGLCPKADPAEATGRFATRALTSS